MKTQNKEEELKKELKEQTERFYIDELPNIFLKGIEKGKAIARLEFEKKIDELLKNYGEGIIKDVDEFAIKLAQSLKKGDEKWKYINKFIFKKRIIQ